MASDIMFQQIGVALPSTDPSWSSGSERWAPENHKSGDGQNFAIFSDNQRSQSVHRMGYAISNTGVERDAWSTYSQGTLDLGNTAGGEIDSHVFTDPATGTALLAWKSDDNRAGMPTTRHWGVNVAIGNSKIELLGTPRVMMDSTGLWWVDSWVDGGSLIEGPEFVFKNGYYYQVSGL
jgi:hypothetical protein